MIPKVIHYCWISSDSKPSLIQKCIQTWMDIMPDYQIKCWSKDNIEDCNIPFVKEAISVKQYPAAADYIRLYALYTEGGIYLDSDIEALRPFDEFLDNHFFSGTEAAYHNESIRYNIEAAIMGAEKGHPFIRECMKYYEGRHFIHENGEYDNKTNMMPGVISDVAKTMYGYDYQNYEHHFPDGITIYSTDHFTNNLCLDEFLTAKTYAIHRNVGSWMPMEHRGRFFHFCRKHNLMDLYHKIETIRDIF